MGASLGIEGIIPADDKFKKMLAVWEACSNAGVIIPAKIYEFFNNDEPDLKGVMINFLGGEFDDHECITEYKGEYCKGFEIDLDKLPKDIKFIRAYLSY